jgi:hypothetical protein
MMQQLWKRRERSAVWLCFITAAVLCWPISASGRRGYYPVHEINEPISADARVAHAEMIDRVSQSIPNEKIKFKLQGRLVFIRFEDESFCFEESCLTIVTTQCGRTHCPFATAVVPPRYQYDFSGTRKWGQFILFPRKLGDFHTTIMVTDRFVAAYQGL